MRGKYNRHLHHQDQHQHQHQQQKSTFLPMLCSLSSKEQVIKHSHRRCSSTSSSTVTEDPSSPRVGCMGQVKRNNKVVGFPTIISFTTSCSNNVSTTSSATFKSEHINTNNSNYICIVRYHKLKKLFSSKSLTNSPTNKQKSIRSNTDGNSNSNSISNNSRKKVTATTTTTQYNPAPGRAKSHKKSVSMVNLDELDPPLPVVKRVPKEEEGGKKEESVSLWKRRSGGAPLMSLQVQAIHQGQDQAPANTV